jgi:hypothetical protein
VLQEHRRIGWNYVSTAFPICALYVVTSCLLGTVLATHTLLGHELLDHEIARVAEINPQNLLSIYRKPGGVPVSLRVAHARHRWRS